MNKRKVEISPSVLGADLMRLGEEIKLVEKLGITWLHLDHMDGHFVPNISFGPDFVSAMRKQTKLFLDVHLMLSNPMKYIRAYAKAGADLITVHIEAEDDAREMLEEIAAHGIKAGISIKPGTDPEAIRDLLPMCDLVLVMTVEPGFGGQSLREDCLKKIPVLAEMIRETGREIIIEVDGGIKQENAHLAIEAGADMLVMGTGLFRAKDPAAVVKGVRKAAEGKSCAR
ncbi:MAG: ribulose-phosphate 3-epimerase [Clostridia bacterium]|nr:ribulose-phosphate 3-epimerase [Clostridia bacterium]